jgi:predicted Zn-dependent peptidase
MQAPFDSPVFTHCLPNGIRIIHRECQGNLSCCGLVVNAGSRHESEHEFGLAHLAEHMLFKGTPTRKPSHILNQMERVGGELNAYTTKEETFLYSLFLRDDYKRAIALIGDLFFNSGFPEQELEKERDVILDEINVYEDSPSELIFDDFDQLFFPHHALGHRILGHPDTVSALSRDSLIQFHREKYTTDRIVFFSQAPISWKRVLKLSEQFLGIIPATTTKQLEPTVKPVPAHGFRTVIEKDTHQAHVICGNENFSLFETDRTGMYFLNNILGGPGMNSRLNLSLREKSGLVYSVESNVSSFTDSGLFTVYFGTDPQEVDRCLGLLFKEFKRLREKPLTSLQWHAARRQLLGQVMISSENKENQSLSMGKSMLYFNGYDTMEEFVRKIDRYTPEKLMEIANRVLDPDKMSFLFYK